MRVSRPRLGPSLACVRVALAPPRPGPYRSTASRRPAPGPVGCPRWGRMGKALRISFRTEGANPWVVVFCLLPAGLAEGVSLASLLPVLGVAQGGRSARLAASRADGRPPQRAQLRHVGQGPAGHGADRHGAEGAAGLCRDPLCRLFRGRGVDAHADARHPPAARGPLELPGRPALGPLHPHRQGRGQRRRPGVPGGRPLRPLADPGRDPAQRWRSSSPGRWR